MTDRDWDRVIDAFRDSLVYRTAHAAIQRGAIAGAESSALHRARVINGSFASLTPGQKIATLSIAIAIAAIAHLAIRALLPRYAISGLPWWWNVTVAVFATVTAVAAERVAASWPESMPARLWRRLAS